MSLALYSIPFTNYSILLYNCPFLTQLSLNYSKIDQFKNFHPLHFFCLCSTPFQYNLMLLSISLSIYKQVPGCDKKLQFQHGDYLLPSKRSLLLFGCTWRHLDNCLFLYRSSQCYYIWYLHWDVPRLHFFWLFPMPFQKILELLSNCIHPDKQDQCYCSMFQSLHALNHNSFWLS